MNVGKNYFREELINLDSQKPIIISGKYKYNSNSKWLTFTTVRPYIPKSKTYTLCNHINIKKEDVKNTHNLTEEYHNKKFYIIAYPSFYNHYNDIRGTITLANNLHIEPILFNSDKYVINEVVLEKCYRFPSIWIRKKPLTIYKNNSQNNNIFKGFSLLQLACNLTGKCHAVGYIH
ncbi:hypothetical protein N9C25_00185 [Saprospiraceae bacterium]|nr:hypothetical protein [Saprospiraceae bacterium]